MIILSNKEKLLASAQKSLQKGQVAKAIKDYQKLVDLDPRDVRIRQKLAELYSRDRRIEEALDAYGAVAKHYSETGFYLKAIAVYKQMQKVDPGRINIYHRLAELNERQGLIGNALAEYRSLVAFYEKDKKFSDVLKILEKMKDLEPENLNIRVKIAETQAREGMLEKAQEEFQDILERLREKSDFSRIIKLYEMFSFHFSGDLEFLLGKAWALVEQGETTKGLEALKSLLHDDPDNRAILSLLAQAYHKNDDFENERLTYHHLLKLDPDNLEFRSGHIHASLLLDDFLRVLNDLEDWREAFFSAGQAALLKQLYEKLADSELDDPRILVSLRAVYESTGDGDKLFKLLSVIPATQEAAEEELPAESELPGTAAPEAAGEDAEAAADRLDDELELTPIEEIVEERAAWGGEESFAALEPTDHAAEEIPLEFLEEVGEAEPEAVLDLTAEIAEEVPSQSTESDPDASGTADLEMELDLDLDFDLELEEDVPSDEVLTATEDEPVALSETVEEPPLPEELAEETTEAGAAAEALLVDEVIDETVQEIGDAAEEILDDVVLTDAIPAGEVFANTLPEAADALASEPEQDSLEDEASDSGIPAASEIAMAVEQEVGEEDASASTVFADLEEAEFYFQQGLYDAAAQVVQQLLVRVPGCPEALTKLEGIRNAMALAPAPAAAPDPGYHDLTSSLLGDVEDALNRVAADDAEAFSLDAPIAGAIGQTVDQIDSEDGESHFNLGIAYKEMGLLDDAINEFGKALQYPSRALDALTLKGLCLVEKGLYSQAEGVFLSGLNILNLSAEEVTGLRYELGVLYLNWERPQQALEAFEAVAETDPFYREVGGQIDDLRKGLGMDKAGDEAAAATTGKKDRVSFV